MDPPAEPHIFATPRKGEVIGDFLKRLNVEYGLDLPWNANESPSRRPQTLEQAIVGKVQFLYYQDRPGLDKGVDQFRHYLPQLSEKQTRLSRLFGILSVTQTNSLKAKKSRSVQASPRGRRSPSINDLPEPASPTLGIKHAPPSSAEMPDHDVRRSSVRMSRKPSLKRPASQSFHEKITSAYPGNPGGPASRLSNHEGHSSSLMPSPAPVDSSARNRGIASNNTSFASNGLPSANTSFWSDVQHDTQEEPQTPATSIDDSFHTSDGKADSALGLDGADDTEYYGSSPRFDDDFGATQLVQACSSNRPVPRESDFSEFGDSISTQDLECLVDAPYSTLPPTPMEAPMKKHQLTGMARVDHIMRDGLCSLHLPSWALLLPFELRWEIARVLQTERISETELDLHWQAERTVETLYELMEKQGIPFKRGDSVDDGSVGFAANLRWVRSRTGRVLDLELLAPRKEKSNSLEREFGRTRLLYILAPSLTKAPDEMDLGDCPIKDRVLAMMKQEHCFLGRTWRQFHSQAEKSTRKSDPDFQRPGAHQMFFLATRTNAEESFPWKDITVGEVWNWAVPLAQNREMTVAKAVARMDLVASRTLSGRRLLESEIVRNVEDKMPTHHRDDTRFDDMDLPGDNAVSDQPMNDGCQMISTWLMIRLASEAGLDYIPSAVQGRISGAKGLWVRDDANPLDDEKPRKLLWISKSQTKVLQDEAGLANDVKMTFSVVRFSGPTGSSVLYTDFMRILADRRVPSSSIYGFAKSSVRSLVQPLHDALDSPMALRRWLQSQNRFREERNRQAAIETLGAFPISREERIVQMLDAGFVPAECHYLAKELNVVINQVLDEELLHLQLPLLASTMTFGVADETGVLQPGEIHYVPSKQFKDAHGIPTLLAGRTALVGRMPALGPSDVQKMRIVQRPCLQHLVDVVVFSTKGQRAQASKLQGGDYDGDTFWVCWEPSLVDHFRNAPVQDANSKPERFGIQVSKEKLGSVLKFNHQNHASEDSVLSFIAKGTEARMAYDMLGLITLALEKLTYDESSLRCDGSQELFLVHSHMIDADKQGYTLPKYKRDLLWKKHGIDERPTPAFRLLHQGEPASKLKPKPGNVVDDVFFNIHIPALDEARSAANALVEEAPRVEDGVWQWFTQERTLYAAGSPGRRELFALVGKVGQLIPSWNEKKNEWQKHKNSDEWNRLVERIREEFESIEPSDPNSETMLEWLRPQGSMPSRWALLKAGALMHTKASSKLMFTAAGPELCAIKTQTKPYPRLLAAEPYGWYKVRPQKMKVDEQMIAGRIGSERPDGADTR